MGVWTKRSLGDECIAQNKDFAQRYPSMCTCKPLLEEAVIPHL